VPPLAGGLLVWLTFLLGRRLFGSFAGFAGAVLVATSPVFLFQLVWPMADITAAVLWTLALLLLLRPRPGTLVAGLVVSLAILVRPNLVPAAGVLAVWAASRGGGRGSWSPAALQPVLLFVAGMLPGIVGTALLNAHLYGSPLQSGYGSLASLYSPAFVLPNLSNYGGWLVEKHTPIVLLALLPLAWPRAASWRRPEARLRAMLAALTAVFWLSYLFYYVFEAWWFLRFLLPTWPVMMVLAAAALERFGRRLLGSFALPVVALVVVALGARGFLLDREGILGLFIGEHRYVAVAKYVAEHTEPGAVILSMQHSGSLRYYGSRLTLRYDMIPPEWLDRALAFLQETGRRPYLVLEDWEHELFQQRFAGHSTLAALDFPPMAELPRPVNIRLYDPLRHDAREPSVIPFPVAEPCITRPHLRRPE
jgi:hypothetical protein